MTIHISSEAIMALLIAILSWAILVERRLTKQGQMIRELSRAVSPVLKALGYAAKFGRSKPEDNDSD